MSEVKISDKARQLLAKEYEIGGREGAYPSYAHLARTGSGEFTLCSLRAIQKALDRGPGSDALAAQRDEGLAREAELREDLAIFKGAISALGEASKKLCFNARTVTDAPDQALMDACEAVEQTITLSGIARAMDYVEGLRNENAQLSEKYEAARDRKNSITFLQQRLAEAKRLLLDVRGQLCGPDQRAIDAFLASPGCADGEKVCDEQLPIAEDVAAQLERTDWTPEQALKWYAEGRHFDVVAGRTRIIDTGHVASNALKHLSAEYLEHKGDAQLHELQQRLAEDTDLLKHMTCSYHRALENGYDRIIFLGGDCDSVERMERDDPFYSKARAFLASPGCADGEKS